MKKKLLLMSSIMAVTLGASTLGVISADLNYIQTSNIQGYNTKQSRTSTPTVIDSSMHEIVPDGAASELDMNGAKWTYTPIETDEDTGKNVLYASVSSIDLMNPSNPVGFNYKYIDHYNENEMFNGSTTLEEVSTMPDNETRADEWSIFQSPLAVMKNGDNIYYGYVGYIDESTGEFVKHSIKGIDGAAHATNFDYGDDIVFQFPDVPIEEYTDVEIGIIDGMMNLKDPTTDIGYGAPLVNTLGSAIESWEELDEWPEMTQVEFISLSGKDNDSLNNKPILVDGAYFDPVVDESFSLSNQTHNSVDVTFDIKTFESSTYYQTFTEGALGETNNNVLFYEEGNKAKTIDATLLSSTEDTDANIRTFTYKLDLETDYKYEGIDLDISFDNDDGIINSIGEAVPKTRTHNVTNESVVVKWDNPLNLTSPETKFNDENGQFAAHIMLNQGGTYLPLDTEAQDIKLRFENSNTGTSGVFGQGLLSKYETEINLADDGSYIDLAIVNPGTADFVDLTTIYLMVDTLPEDTHSDIYTLPLKTYSSSTGIGDTTLIKSISSFEMGSDINVKFIVDSVNNSEVDTKAALEAEGITFGYGSSSEDRVLEIDSDANPINPTDGTAFTSTNEFTVTNESGTWYAETVLTPSESLSEYTDLYMDIDGAFRIYDYSNTSFSLNVQNPIIGGSGEVSNLTGDSATISFSVNDGDQFASYIPESATFSAMVDGSLQPLTATFVSKESEVFSTGTSTLTYDITGLEKGKTYKNVQVELEYSDSFVSEGPRIIVSSFQTLKDNPIIADSGTVELIDSETMNVSFNVLKEKDGEDIIADYITSSATFEATNFTGSESSRYLSEEINGDGTATLTYQISGLVPNTEYSNLTVDFIYKDGFAADPTQIVAGPFTTIRLNPIIENSAKISNVTSDSMEITFSIHNNPTGEHETYANYNADEATITSDDFDASVTTDYQSTAVSAGDISKITYSIHGLKPGETYSNIYVDFPFTDGFDDDAVLVYSDKAQTDKLNPIMENSGSIEFIGDTKANISFDVHDDIAGQDQYANYIFNSAKFSFGGSVNGEKATFSGASSNGDDTTKITYTIEGLTPNMTYTNIGVTMDYYDTFVQSVPVTILDEFTVPKLNPIKEGSGEVVSTTEDSVVISFDVHEDAFQEDQYANYIKTDATFHTTSEGGMDWVDNVTFINSELSGENHDYTTLTYEITDLTDNTPYSNISVELGYDDGSSYESTLILDSFVTDSISQDPVITTSFSQDYNLTTDTSVTFTFQYRQTIWVDGPKVAKIGYADGNVFSRSDWKIEEGTADDSRTIAIVTINNLEVNTIYSDIWLELDDEDHTIVNAKEQGTIGSFSIRTRGLEPIIQESGSFDEITDNSVEIKYQYNVNNIWEKNGSYYDFDPENAKLGYYDEGIEILFTPSMIEYNGSEKVNSKSSTYEASYTVSGLNAGTLYEDVFVKVTTSNGSNYELPSTIISSDGFETKGLNPVESDTIEIENLVPSDGTEAMLKFTYRDYSSVNTVGDEGFGYSAIDPTQTLVGYESTGVENNEKALGEGGIFDSEYIGSKEVIDGIFYEASIKLTNLNPEETYNGIYIIVFDDEGNMVSRVSAKEENAQFKPIPSNALPMTAGEIAMWFAIALLLFLIIWLFLFFGIRYAKKHFALALFMDEELSMDESEIVFNLINVKHKAKLWNTYEGNLVLYAAGRKVDAIFKRSTELHNGYKVYITEDFSDKETILSLLNSTKYSKFSVGLYKDHHRYHVASVSDAKAKKLITKLDKTDSDHYDEVLHDIVDHLDDEHIEAKLMDSIDGVISGINRRKSTDKTLRYQAIIPHDHSLNDEAFFDENSVTFWHVYDGDLYQLKYNVVQRFGSLVEIDLIGLKPGTSYVGLTISYDGGKTFVPSSAVYGITRDAEGMVPNLTNAKLGGKTTGAKKAAMWDMETCVTHVGERLAAYHERVITKTHFENDPSNKGKIISLHDSHKQFKNYIEKWWKEAAEAPAKTTKAKTTTKK